MSGAVANTDVQRFRSAIVRRIGLQFDDAKLGFLGDVLQRRLSRLACSSTCYIAALEREPPQRELSALAEELTVGETYFFRHNDQFRALAEVALPQRVRARDRTRTLRLLSAGCASGEEAYSLAIVTKQISADPSWNVFIHAVDLNPIAVAKAKRARYSAWALRDAPPEIKTKWFRSEGRDLVLRRTVRDAVQFEEGNLANGDLTLWQPDCYDVVFCRNVLMYFDPEQMRAAVARIAASLAPGGFLFLGHAETLRGMSDDFHLCHTHETFYYRRKEQRPIPTRARDCAAAVANPTPSPVEALAPAVATTWVDTIRQASARIEALIGAPSAKDAAAPPAAPQWQLAAVFELLRYERFSEALDLVCSGPSPAEGDRDLLLVKAVLLVQNGQLAAAEDACCRLLAIDELNAGAHYVLALCRDHSGARDQAIEHDRIAAYLDPAFAMPRLHCGLLARQAGERDVARRELTQALALLEREDISRLLLFGGGFKRDALIALCGSAAAECGDRP